MTPAQAKAIRDEIVLLRGDIAALRLIEVMKMKARILPLGKPLLPEGLPAIAREIRLGGMDHPIGIHLNPVVMADHPFPYPNSSGDVSFVIGAGGIFESTGAASGVLRDSH